MVKVLYSSVDTFYGYAPTRTVLIAMNVVCLATFSVIHAQDVKSGYVAGYVTTSMYLSAM